MKLRTTKFVIYLNGWQETIMVNKQEDFLYTVGLKATKVWLDKNDVFLEVETVGGRKLTFQKVKDEPTSQAISS